MSQKKLEYDSNGRRFIMDCILIHCENTEACHFFTIWVHPYDGVVQPELGRFNKMIGMNVEAAIQYVKDRGYKIIDL